MNRLDVRSAEHHALIAWLFRETRRGRFPGAFASMWEDSLVRSDQLLRIGADIETILEGRDGYRTKGSRIGRLGVGIARRFDFGRPDQAHPQSEFIDGIFDLADYQRSWSPRPVEQAWVMLPGFLVGTAELLLACDMAAEELAADPQILVALAYRAAKANGLHVSVTDVSDTLRYGLTRFGSIVDWVDPEVVQCLRARLRSTLVDLLASSRATRFLRQAIALPGGPDWLLRQMESSEERGLLRTRLLRLRRERRPSLRQGRPRQRDA